MAVIEEAQGKYDDSIVILTELLQKTERTNGQYDTSEKNNRAIFMERLGTVYRESNKPQLAIDTFRRMFDLGDENAVRGYQQIIETFPGQKEGALASPQAEEAAKKY